MPLPARQAYVKPGLISERNREQASVIVTAGDATAAARAVERAGGQVTSDLWLIDAVAAPIPVAPPGRAGRCARRPLGRGQQAHAHGWWQNYAVNSRHGQPNQRDTGLGWLGDQLSLPVP